jgi:hypothetical protein
MTLSDTLRRSRDLLATGAATSLAEALRAATDDVSARIEAWRLVREASLPSDTPLEAVEATLMAIECPGGDESSYAYCGAPAGWHTVPGATGGSQSARTACRRRCRTLRLCCGCAGPRGRDCRSPSG